MLSSPDFDCSGFCMLYKSGVYILAPVHDADNTDNAFSVVKHAIMIHRYDVQAPSYRQWRCIRCMPQTNYG